MSSVSWGLGSGADVCVPFVGYSSLSGCRYLGAGGEDDAVACAWNTHAVDASALAHIIGTEGAGLAADTVDSCPLTVGAWEAEGWLGDASIKTSWLANSGKPNVATNASFTVEFWCYRDVLATGDIRRLFLLTSGSNSVIEIDEYTPSVGVPRIRFLLQGTSYVIRTITTALFSVGWHHVSLERSGNIMNSYVDGTRVDTVDCSAANTTATKTSWNAPSAAGQVRRWNDIYVTQSALHSGSDFSPVRYKSSAQNGGVQPYAQVSHASLTGMVPASVSWSATVGASYGQVKRIWCNSASGWTQVGGDYPTSPITVSGLVLPSADAIRVELEPKADALQSETPLLDWLHLDYTAPLAGGRVYRPTPYRLGPKLIPIGVLS